MRVALAYEEFRLDRSLARDRVLIARGLTRLGIEVHVYCNPRHRITEPPGVVFHDVSPLARAPTRFGRAFEYGSFAVAATRRLRKERPKYDIIDVAGTTAWEHDVVRVHALQEAERRRWPTRGGRGYRFAQLRAATVPLTQPRLGVAEVIERLQYRPGRVKRVLAVTPAVKNDLEETLRVDAGLVDVVAYPVDTDRFATAETGELRRRLQLRPDDFVALFVGHDFERKGLREAIAGIAAARRRIVLAVVGEGDPTSYDNLASGLGVADRVHFLGSTDQPESFFADADAFLLPSREDVWGVTVIEAMAAGVPVIVSDVAGAAEVVRDTGAGILVSGSGADVGHALDRLAADDYARTLGQRGRAAARRFDVSVVADEVAAAYERVAAERRRTVE